MNIKRIIPFVLASALLSPQIIFSQSVQNFYTISSERTGGYFSAEPGGLFTAIAGSLTDTLGPYDGYITLFNTDGSVKVNKRLDGGQTEEVNAVHVGQGAYTYLAGSFLPATGYDGLLARFDTTGFTGWACKAASAGTNEQLYAVMSYSDSLGNNRLVAGGSTLKPLPGNTVDAWLVVTSSFFPSLVWNAVYAGPGDEKWNAVYFTSDEKILAAGSTTAGGFGGKDILVARYSADGTLDWVRSYGGPGDDEALSVTENKGSVYISGYTTGAGSFIHSPFVASLDASTGNLGNVRNYPTTPGETMEAWSVEVGADSTLYVTGGGDDIEGFSFILTLSPDLNLRRKNTYRLGEILKGCAPQADGSIWAGGVMSLFDPYTSGDFCLLHTDDTLGVADGCAGIAYPVLGTPAFSDTAMVDSSYLLSATIIVWNFDPYLDSTVTSDACAAVHAADAAPPCGLMVYPQPATEYLHLQFSSPLKREITLQVYSLAGQMSCNHLLLREGNQEISLDVSSFPAGVYLMRVSDENRSFAERFMVQH
jgi:hypothetical protein